LDKSFRILIAAGVAGVALLAACSRSEPPAPAPAAAPVAAPAPPAPPEMAPPMSDELAARLVRPHSPVLGPANAPVTLVEVLDPACEACAAFAPIVKQIQLLHGDDVRVVVRYAAFHRGSDEAIRILEAARRQGKFESTLAALFDGQAEWASHHAPDVQKAWLLAKASGLDMTRAQRDAKSAQSDQVLRVEGEDVIALKVTQTPTFFVNARPLTEFGQRQLFDLVQAEVTRARDQSTPKP
jgi:protein-disulfide isomerase